MFPNKSRRTLLSSIAGFVVLVAIGYGSAGLSQSRCSALTRASAMQSNLSGRDMGGKVQSARDVAIESRVLYPFVVHSSFSLPRDIHATVYVFTYFTALGIVVPLDRKALYLV
jgi:hypothetical protein